MTIKDGWIVYIQGLQDRICNAIEATDAKSAFIEDTWEREEGGGGRTRVISKGNIFEKGGVNTSIVFGDVSEAMRDQLKMAGDRWFACGLSLVLHPANPFVPTVHCNYRMLELYNRNNDMIDRWFGGGTDLTPYYLFDEDARHFHGTYKKICDHFDVSFYPLFKKECDQYFVNRHRNNEMRGIGGIFYDYQRPSIEKNEHFWLNFAQSCGNGFMDAYLPIVEKRKDLPYTPEQKFWQEVRRGRYTEFNLIHDRGTLFGLKTAGRTESILMSLPPTARFEYNYHPSPGSEEAKLLEACLNPRDWV